MVQLEGHDAAVVMAAKGGFNDIRASHMECLKAAFAVLAGLTSMDMVRDYDVLQIVARVHDTLSRANLLLNPARSMIESLSNDRMWSAMHPGEKGPEIQDVVLRGLMGPIACMRIRTESGEQLVEWTSAMEPGFSLSVSATYERRHAVAMDGH